MDAFLNEMHKKKVSNDIKQKKWKKKLQNKLVDQELPLIINTNHKADISMTSIELVTLPKQIIKESILKESSAELVILCELKSSGSENNTSPKKIPYNQKVE